MRQKPNRLFSRAAAMLLTVIMAFAGAQTAGAADVTTNITYDGVAASDVTVSVTYTVQSTGFPPTEETKHETLSNGSRFYPVDNTVVTIAVTSSASITTEFSATYLYFGVTEQTLAVNTSGNNCTFTPDPDYETTLNITVRQGGGGQQTGGVTPVTLTDGAVNMPVTGTSSLTIPNGVTTFKVYDDGGPSGNYSAGCDGYLLLTAPGGCLLQVKGTADTNIIASGQNYLTIFDGGTTDDATVLNRFQSSINAGDGNYGTRNDIGTVNSTGRQLLIYFHTTSGDPFLGASYPDKGLDLTVTVKLMSDHFTQSGDTYTILSATGWNVFCDLLEENAKGYFTGKTVMLYRDIEVSRMAGSESKPFTGTFEGNKKTLTVSYGSADSPITEQYAAPFRYVDGGSFENLHVAGTIYTAAKYTGGLIAYTTGGVTIQNCRSSVTIQSYIDGDGTHGGFVALHQANALTFYGCVFDGSLLGNKTNKCGGFIGWRSGGANIYNSLFAPADVTVLNTESATFARNDVDTHNCYYTTLLNDGKSYVPGYNEQNAVWRNGKAPRSVTGSEYVTVEAVSPVGDATDTYTVSGITAYAKGIERGGTFCYGQSDDVSLTLSHGERSGYLFSGYSPSAGTLSGTTLTMPDDNVTINAVFTDNRYFVHFDKNAADATGTMDDQAIGIGSTANLTSNAFTRDGYYFKSWNTEADGSGTAYGNGASVTNLAALGQTVTLYAQWSDNWFSSSICVPENGSIRAIIPDDASSFKIYDPAGNAHSYQSMNPSTGYLLLTAPDECVIQLTGRISANGRCELTVYDGSSTDDTQIGYCKGYASTSGNVWVSLSDNVISTGKMMLIKAYFPGGTTFCDFDLTATVGHRVDVAAGLEHGTVSAGRTVFHEGTTVTLTPQPDEGYSVATVSVGGTPIEPVDGAYSFTMPGEDVIVSATFTKNVLALSDNADNASAIATAAGSGKVYEVTLAGRTLFKDGAWNTLCLPFDVTVGSGQMAGATAMTLNASQSGFDSESGLLTLYFDGVNDGSTIAAGTPFIVKWTGDNVSDPMFSGVTVSSIEAGSVVSDDCNVRFQGTYSPAVIYSAANDNLYLGAENRLYWPRTEDITLGSCRAYFHVDLNGGAAAVRAFNLNFGESSETTEIISTTDFTDYTDYAGAWYSLDGRKLDAKPTKRGVYIHHGKKIVVK